MLDLLPTLIWYWMSSEEGIIRQLVQELADFIFCDVFIDKAVGSTATIGLKVGSTGKTLSGYGESRIENVLCLSFETGFLIAQTRLVNFRRCKSWATAVASAVGFQLVTDDAGAFTGDLTFENCQAVAPDDGSGKCFSVVCNQTTASMHGIRFTECIGYKGDRVFELNITAGTSIADIWIDRCQADGSGGTGSNSVYMSAAAGVIENVHITDNFFSGGDDDVVSVAVGGTGVIRSFEIDGNWIGPQAANKYAINVFQCSAFKIHHNTIVNANYAAGAAIVTGGVATSFIISDNLLYRNTGATTVAYMVQIGAGADRFIVANNEHSGLATTATVLDGSTATVRHIFDYGVFSDPITLTNEGLHLLDTNASHDLIVKPGSDLTADRIITITTGDAARTLTLSGNPTLADWFDQSVKVADSPQFAGVNVGHATDTTVSRVSAGDIQIEANIVYRAGGTDVPVADGGTGSSTAAGAATNLGLGTGDSPQFTAVNVGHASDTTVTRVSAGVAAIEGLNIARATGALTDNAVVRADGTVGGVQNSAFLVDDSGHVSSFGGNIAFPATQAASADANTLDDYEEGTWTPSLGGNTTYTAQVGHYRKIGSVVHIWCYLLISVIGTGSTTTISGLPFTSAAGLGTAFSVGYFTGLATNVVSIAGFVDASASTLAFSILTAAAAGVTYPGAIFGSNTTIVVSGSYHV